MKTRFYKTLLLCLGLAAAFFILYVAYIWLGVGIPCLFFSLTKIQCPACGTFRMLAALTTLDIAAAFEYNAAMLCLLPLLAILLSSYVYKYIRHDTKQFSKWQSILSVIIIIILIAFFIYRLSMVAFGVIYPKLP